MSEKNNYLIQIIEKVNPEKIIDIVNSQPKIIKKKKFSNRLYIFLLSCLIAGSPAYSIYLLIYHLYEKHNFIEVIIFGVGVTSISTALAGLLISIFEFIKTIFKNKNKESLFLKIKKSYYFIKYSCKIAYSDIEEQSICHDLYKEISKYFKEDEMLKIVEMKFKNKDFKINYTYKGKNEEEKIEFKKENIKNVKNLLNDLYEEKKSLEKRKDDELKRKQEKQILANKFTKSLYE